jgi:hypothetical protein
MADQVDVEEAFASAITSAIYPSGVGTPSALPAAAPVQIRRGWPIGGDVDAAMKLGLTLVTIYPRGDTEISDARYPEEWQTRDAPVHTLTAVIDNGGSRITLGGTAQATPPQYISVVLGTSKVYSYTLLVTDTLTSVAAALAALIKVDYPATTSTGPVLNIVGPIAQAVVGSTGTSWKEVGRQKQWFQIVVWAPSDPLRTAVIRIIDPILRLIKRLPLADGSVANIAFVRTIVEDRVEKELIFRRDLIFVADYPTSVTETDFQITAITENIGPTQNPTPPTIISI